MKYFIYIYIYLLYICLHMCPVICPSPYFASSPIFDLVYFWFLLIFNKTSWGISAAKLHCFLEYLQILAIFKFRILFAQYPGEHLTRLHAGQYNAATLIPVRRRGYTISIALKVRFEFRILKYTFVFTI